MEWRYKYKLKEMLSTLNMTLMASLGFFRCSIFYDKWPRSNKNLATKYLMFEKPAVIKVS